jgi:uncharacterized protein
MANDLFDVKDEKALVLRVHVQPGAGRTTVVGRHGTALKIRVAAPPTGGRANEECCEVVAGIFGVKPAAVSVTGGQSSRDKRLTVEGADLEEAGRLLEEAILAADSKPGQRPLDGRE